MRGVESLVPRDLEVGGVFSASFTEGVRVGFDVGNAGDAGAKVAPWSVLLWTFPRRHDVRGWVTISCEVLEFENTVKDGIMTKADSLNERLEVPSLYECGRGPTTLSRGSEQGSARTEGSGGSEGRGLARGRKNEGGVMREDI